MSTRLQPWILCLLVLPATAGAQGTVADYKRAADLPNWGRNLVAGARVNPQWLPDGNRFWYRNDLAEGRTEFILVDGARGTRARAFDHKAVAAALAKATGKPVAADRLPITALSFADGGKVILSGGGKSWQWDPAAGTLAQADASANEASLPALPFPRPTRRNGDETNVTFANNTRSEVRIAWINSDGVRVPYGTVAAGARRDMHTFSGHVWLVTDAAGNELGAYEAADTPGVIVIDGKPAQRRRRRDTEAAPEGAPSPDGKMLALVRDGNILLRDLATGADTPLTTDGSTQDAYHDPAWSPNSAWLGALKTRAAQEHKVYIVESSPKDQLQPKLLTLDYLKPGDRIAETRPHLFSVASRKETVLDQALTPTPWDIWDLQWLPDSSRMLYYYNQRGHQVLRLLSADPATGKVVAAIDEQSKTFIDYAGKFFCHILAGTGEAVWMSERDGWNHLYLVDLHSGAVKNPITRGEWVVRAVDRVDVEKRQVWFQASGIDSAQDPYHIHYCRVNLDGTGLVRLTRGDGTHRISHSPNQDLYLDTYSRVDLPPVTELRRTADGTLACTVEKADAGALVKRGWQLPERFVAKARDGKTDIWGVIIKPTSFRKGRRYPVIENIYAGPQGSFTPKAWSTYHGMQEIAELGFILVQMDGMGTSNRSKAFHDVCWKNLGDAGFPDRMAWIRQAARTRPYMDLSRVGIYGGSAGGQNALRALEAHGDFYKAAVADCGCHDNRMDKVWWNELWMGWPIGPHYAEQSNVTNAGKITGKLLLVVGEMDTNVDPASTMQVVNALVKADKDFDLLVVPGGGHGSAESPYGRRRRQDFFVRNLLHVEPRSK